MNRIVVVEDSPTQAQYIAAQLSGVGFEVFIAYDGAEALQLVDEVLPDAIVLDVNLPTMNGIQVCRRLKRDDSLEHIPVVMLTSADGREDIIQGIDAGAIGYIPKDAHAMDNLLATLAGLDLSA